MTKLDPAVVAHQEWIGYVQPTGLVVSAHALVRAGAILDRRDAEGQLALRASVEERSSGGEPEPCIPDFVNFATNVLGWNFSPNGFAGTDETPVPAELEVALSEYDEVLRADFAVRELDPQPEKSAWQMLVRIVGPDQDLDAIEKTEGRLEASVHGRMERLLRQTGVTAGLLFNGRVIRLMSAPRGETSGWIDFRVTEMVQTGGRPICTALRLLLSQTRLLSLPRAQRLAALLTESRRFQNEVSERLAEQVLHALYELLRGFQSAHDASGGRLLDEPLREDPDDVYRAMLTVLMRLVFLLYSEERGMLPTDETFIRSYSLSGLYERLREDAALNPDTMGQRFGAWGQLLVLFRLIFDGNATLALPKRHGVVFDPDRFAFLEGRERGTRQVHERIEVPLIPDGTVFRALDKLLVLDGERISYSALDVEQIGSVYETMMGFRLERATGQSVAIKPQKKRGAPTTVDLEALLATDESGRGRALQEKTERKLTDRVLKAVREAERLEDLHAALVPIVDANATPDLVPAGAMVLQPSPERRRTGSHYTPRTLTGPIVRTTLRPVLDGLCADDRVRPRPEQILSLKVCDPAMGSGAFLVEACRQLADELVESWKEHDEYPQIPPGEDEVVFARRLVAQRCLYGVDRNPMAVDLAKVSLWLVTLAREHSLTFLDHALRHGDTLVGLSRRQIESFHWDPQTSGFEAVHIGDQLETVASLRRQIQDASEFVTDSELHDLWERAELELSKVRLFGDLVVTAFFEADRPKERAALRQAYAQAVMDGKAEQYRTWLDAKRSDDPPLAPFHWSVEFPEVFDRDRPGFDAIVGNPPFLGGTRISTVAGMTYFQWLTSSFAHCRHLCDLVAYFFRRAFDLLRDRGSFGLIATNTIAQGDTREGGLRQILNSGGRIYSATGRFRWPGSLAVVVSIVHVVKGSERPGALLDGRPASRVSAYLTEGDNDDSPARLKQNPYFSLGTKIYGQGFLFADDDNECTPLSERDRLISQRPDLEDRIRPYIGGEEILSHPQHMYHRYAILLSDIQREEDLERWPELRQIVHEKVKPGRDALGDNPNNTPLKRRWWAFQAHRPELYARLSTMTRVLVTSQVNPRFGFAMLPADWIFSQKAVVICIDNYSGFSVVQSRIHELWARFFSSTSMELMSYTPSDCFETFPFPTNWESDAHLEQLGLEYHAFRAELMARNDEGLTKTYGRFHDPDEHESHVTKLRELHAGVDRAVLDAYGWRDVPTDCEFLLDYEVDEDEGRRRKPWRYRWPDDVHDEVLSRLLKLNVVRAREEAAAGSGTKPRRAGARPTTRAEKLFS